MNQRTTAMDPQIPQGASSSRPLKTARKFDSSSWRRLVVCAITMLLLWTQLLPRLEKYGVVRTFIERMQEQGINPSAVYYTEHPASHDWERTIRERIGRNPNAFWSLPSVH
jgi:hypothetical protein